MGIEERAGAWRLLGKELDNGWKIIEPIGWDPRTGDKTDHYNGTGGNFSVPYLVEKDGKRAFLKAIDLTNAMNSVDVMIELQNISAAHNFEMNLLNICKGASMNRVVVALEIGQLNVGPNIQDTAPYLIFELANGDVRKRVQKKSGSVRLAWWLRSLHHAAIGLSQLHTEKITHQDLKPSNLLSFGPENGFKLSDLGRSTCENAPGPHDALHFSGDRGYAPPEILYGQISPEAFERRKSCDLYMLGSMIFFFASGFGCTPLLFNKLPLEQRPAPFGGWLGNYLTILPIIQHLFTNLLYEMSTDLPNGKIGDGLIKAASELCNPDPVVRGHPLEKGAGSNHLSLARYVSLFDYLAKLADIEARKSCSWSGYLRLMFVWNKSGFGSSVC